MDRGTRQAEPAMAEEPVHVDTEPTFHLWY